MWHDARTAWAFENESKLEETSNAVIILTYIVYDSTSVRLREFCMLGVQTSRPHISACVENAYKGP